MNSSVKYGVILGLVNSVLSGILYAMGLEVMMSPLAYIQIVVSIGLFVYFGIQCRKENGGYFTFGEAFKTLFVMGAIASVIGLGFNILLNTVIDPDLYENTLAVTIEKTREVYDAQGVDEAAAEKGIEMVKSMTPDMKKPSTMMLSLVMQMVFAAIGSAIVGAIIKKQDPEFANF